MKFLIPLRIRHDIPGGTYAGSTEEGNSSTVRGTQYFQCQYICNCQYVKAKLTLVRANAIVCLVERNNWYQVWGQNNYGPEIIRHTGDKTTSYHNRRTYATAARYEKKN